MKGKAWYCSDTVSDYRRAYLLAGLLRSGGNANHPGGHLDFTALRRDSPARDQPHEPVDGCHDQRPDA